MLSWTNKRARFCGTRRSSGSTGTKDGFISPRSLNGTGRKGWLVLKRLACFSTLCDTGMVLSGQDARYLPKECYLRETGTAESALLIEEGDGSSPCFKKEEAVPENLQFGLVNRILARFFRR